MTERRDPEEFKAPETGAESGRKILEQALENIDDRYIAEAHAEDTVPAVRAGRGFRSFFRAHSGALISAAAVLVVAVAVTAVTLAHRSALVKDSVQPGAYNGGRSDEAAVNEYAPNDVTLVEPSARLDGHNGATYAGDDAEKQPSDGIETNTADPSALPETQPSVDAPTGPEKSEDPDRIVLFSWQQGGERKYIALGRRELGGALTEALKAEILEAIAEPLTDAEAQALSEDALFVVEVDDEAGFTYNSFREEGLSEDNIDTVIQLIKQEGTK